jgi:outer membrane immunogenic protein
MKRYVVACVALAAFSSAGLASDMPAPRQSYPAYMEPVRGPAVLPFNWGGLYAGLNLGGGFTDVSGVMFRRTGRIQLADQPDRFWRRDRPPGFRAGRQRIVRQHWASPRSITNSTGSAPSAAGSATPSWIVGCPTSPSALAYGGRSARVPGTGISGDDTNVGWAIGVGVDYAINQWWTARLEYLHVSLDGFNLTSAGVTAPVGTLDNDIIRGAVNYKIPF